MAIQHGAAKPRALEKPEPQAPQVYDMAAKKDEIALALKGSQELEALTAQISLDDPSTIAKFGSEAATNISKVSDDILNGMDMSQIDGSKQMLDALSKVMQQFDLEEIASEEKPGLFGKLLGSARKSLDRIMGKYNTMGQEVDRIYIQLKQYEAEIEDSNKKLGTLFETNAGFYQELVKYIVAGDQALAEIDAYLSDLQDKPDATQGMNSVELQTAQQAREMMAQRVMDLRIAENVALQSIPMLQAIRFGNMNLVRKIDSAFVVTLPVFKQALAQAILIKRQKLQADAMTALDEKTNEMILKNAQNSVNQAALTARLANSGPVQIETLEKTWKTIMDGIEETNRIQAEASEQRRADAARLSELNQAFLDQARKNRD